MAGQHPDFMAERLRALTQNGPDTDMGRLLRKFWQPVALSASIKTGAARPLRVLGEDLTLYRGESGRAYLVASRCAHRLTLLHTGWVQGEDIRCIYHGWKYDGTGQCNEAPAEGGESVPELAWSVDPQHRRRGIGAALMTQWVKANPHQSAVRLAVPASNPAVRLYERLGFTPTGERQPLPSDPALAEIRMSREL